MIYLALDTNLVAAQIQLSVRYYDYYVLSQNWPHLCDNLDRNEHDYHYDDDSNVSSVVLANCDMMLKMARNDDCIHALDVIECAVLER